MFYVGVLRGERRHGNARLSDALLQLRANSVVVLEFHALWIRGVMAELEGDQSLAAEQYRDILSLWHETEDRMCAVPGVVSAAGFYADRGDGANLATLGQPREAEEKRREAFELARRLGLRPFLDCLQSDTVPAASLLSEDASRPAAAIGLTPRQRSILDLIAKGLTNKEIASHLNLSARTIEMHVALALERLNCRTRSEGVSRALSQGLLGTKA